MATWIEDVVTFKFTSCTGRFIPTKLLLDCKTDEVYVDVMVLESLFDWDKKKMYEVASNFGSRDVYDNYKEKNCSKCLHHKDFLGLIREYENQYPILCEYIPWILNVLEIVDRYPDIDSYEHSFDSDGYGNPYTLSTTDDEGPL